MAKLMGPLPSMLICAVCLRSRRVRQCAAGEKKLVIQIGSQDPFRESATSAEGLVDLQIQNKGTRIRISQPPRDWVKEEYFKTSKNSRSNLRRNSPCVTSGLQLRPHE